MTDTKPIFDIIQFSSKELAEYLNEYIRIGLSSNRLVPADLTIITTEDLKDDKFIDVAHAVKHGTPLLDAFAYFNIPEADRPDITKVEELPEFHTTSLLKAAECIAYFYFFLMTRGNVPEGEDATVGKAVPAFLHNVLGFEDPPNSYVKAICSFNPKKIDHFWIKYVIVKHMSRPTLNRFALALAGYRALQLFRLCHPEILDDQDAVHAFHILTKLVNRGYLWDIHPVTRTTKFLSKVGSLNENCFNIALLTLTEQTLTMMVTLRILYQYPVAKPQFVQFRTWKDDVFDEFTDYILLTADDDDDEVAIIEEIATSSSDKGKAVVI